MIRRTILVACVSLLLAPSARAQVKLEYKFKEGHSTKTKVTSKVQQTLTLAGMDIETSADEVIIASSSAGKRADDGTLPVRQTIDSIRVQFTIMGQTYNYDTADPNAKIELPQLAFVGDVLKALAGSTYTVVLDKSNKVKAVEGGEKVLEKAKDLDPMALETLKDRLEVDRIRREFEKSHANLPTILVREGEPWEQTETDDIGSGQTLTFRRRYEYKGTVQRDGKTLDRIAITALDVKYAMDPDSKSPLKVTKSDLAVDSSKGEMLFDREAGEVVERKGVTRIKGDMDFKINDMDLPGKLDLTLDTTVETGAVAK
jgi:hypothetical protein